MKSVFAIAALCGATTAMVTNELIYKEPKRLNTELVQFVDNMEAPASDDLSLISTESVRRPSNKENIGVRFVE